MRFPFWGKGIIIDSTTGDCLAVVLNPGLPPELWPPADERIRCNDNRFRPATGEVWLISLDAGTFFLEELMQDAQQIAASPEMEYEAR